MSTLFTPGDFHRIEADRNTAAKFTKILFEENVVNQDIPAASSFYCHTGPCMNFLSSVFDEIQKSRDQTYQRLLINTAVYALYANGNPVSANTESSGYRLAAQAVRLINERFTEEIDLKFLAKTLSVTPEYLSAVFKTTVGIGFSKYVTNLRLNTAADALQNTDRSVTEICYACGYRNFSHFLRSFKMKYGVSPNKFRHI